MHKFILEKMHFYLTQDAKKEIMENFKQIKNLQMVLNFINYISILNLVYFMNKLLKCSKLEWHFIITTRT